MNEYQNTNVTGKSWVRAKRIVIENQLDQPPQVRFVEERVVNTDSGEAFNKDVGNLEVSTTPEQMQESIRIRDPETGEATATEMTLAEVYAVIKSTYIHFAEKRDKPAQEENANG